jgi:Tol biopolymer transport system component
MKRLLNLLFGVVFIMAACAPAPATPIPVAGTPVAPLVTVTPTAFPAGKLPVVAIQTPTPPPPPLPTIKITTLQEHGGRMSWLGSKNKLAFDEVGKDGFADVYTSNLDGSDKQCLTCNKIGIPQKHNGNPEWNPNGEYIVFQSEDPDFKTQGLALGEAMSSPAMGFNNNIWITTADGSKFWEITHVYALDGVLHPIFSPDGNKLMWSEMISSGDMGQWVVKLADFSVRNGQPQVTNIQTLAPLSLQWYELHDFSPDHNSIIFTGLPSGKWFYDTEIYRYDFISQTTERLTQNNEVDEHAHYSPDGKWIIWVSSTDIPQVRASSLQDLTYHPIKTDVWIMNADGSHKQRLTRFNDSNAMEGAHAPVGVTAGDIAWGPDSRSFALRLQIGRDESMVLVEFDPQSLAY